MNPIGAVVEMMLADTTITDLVGQHVYGEEFDLEGDPRKLVLVRSSGGGSLGPGAQSYVPWHVHRMDVFCYGEDMEQARRVYNAVYTLLHQLTRTVKQGTALRDATVTGGPLPGRDSNSDWPYYLAVFDVTATPAS